MDETPERTLASKSVLSGELEAISHQLQLLRKDLEERERERALRFELLVLPSMDIISTLPDAILCHILSFLPIHFSATTSVLARRWRYLWTYIRALRFEEEKYYESSTENKLNFRDMIDRVMLLHKGSMDNLTILVDPNNFSPPCRIDSWISTAIAQNVQVLSLSDLWRDLLPPCCFKCSTLVELTIQNCGISTEPGAVCLPRLKKLHLCYNSYEDDESFANLVSGCSAIENLFIQREYCDGMDCCYVRSPSLKSLVLCVLSCCTIGHHHHEQKLVLDIPAVQYLELYGDFPHIIQAEKLSSLVVADIWFVNAFNSEENIGCWRDMFQFVEKLSNAKSLTCRSPASMMLLNLESSIVTTMFHNLTKLELETDWLLLTELLESADKLEALTIREVKDELKCWRKPEHLPKCLLSSLKYVSINGFAGGEDELNMIRYVLRYAKVLKRIKICPVSHGKSKLKMLKKISYFPRRSRTCRLVFV